MMRVTAHESGAIWLRALRGAALGIAVAVWLVLCAAAWVALIGVMVPAHAAESPRTALEYRRDLTREARAVFGLSAPVPVFAAQIQQESAWRPRAESPYAQGLAQFVPSTADWISEVYPYLGPADVWNPQWSIRAMVRYDKHLLDRYAKPAASDCDAWAFTLSAYNGGQGWLLRDKRQCRNATRCPSCDPTRWFGHVADTPDPRRANWAVEENRGYPQRILLRHQPRYRHWGPTVACDVPA